VKILHVIRDLAVATGGPVAALEGLATAQTRLGHEVLVHTADRGEWPAKPEGVTVISVPSTWGDWAFSPRFGASLARTISMVDVVHLHMVWDYPIWAAAEAARRHGKPFILRPCGQLDSWSMSQRGFKKRVYLRFFGTQVRKAAAIHFTTEGERTSSDRFVGDRPCFVIPNGVSDAAFENLPPSSAFGRRFGRLAGRRVVLFLGRLHPKKQPHLLIDAFARVTARVKGLQLVLAGPSEDTYLRVLKARATARGVADQVTFTGALCGRAVQEAYRAAEVFVLPSLQENFGIAIAEAMAAECPVLVTNNLDLAPDIEAAQAGITCRGSAEEIAGALTAMLNDAAMRARLGANGRALVQMRFRWDRIARMTIDEYQKVLEGSVTPAT
jgi:glycosyltransferase involved in cell wall biosynthesis